jgi:hypothetical protein
MPEFTYSSQPNPFVGSIGAAMLRRGDIAAQRAAAVADAESRAAIASGDAWGRAAQNFGTIAGGVATALTDPRRQMQALELQRAKDLHAGEQRLDQITAPVTPNGPQPEGEGPAPAQHPYLDDQGLYDIPKLTQALSASGMTHLAPELLKGAEQINDSIVKHQNLQQQQTLLQQKTADAQTVMYGDMADGVIKMTKAGMPFEQALDLASAPGLATKRFDPAQFAQIRARLVGLPPEQQEAALGRLMDAAAQVSPEKDLAKDATRLDRYNRVLATNVVPEKPTEASLAADAANEASPTAARSKTALDLLHAAKATPAAGQLHFGRVDGKGPVVAAVFDPTSRTLTYNGENVTNRFEAPTDPAERQAAAIAAQVAQQARAQNFQTLVKAKEDLEKNVITPYVTARTSAETLRDVVDAAKHGNEIAGSLQSLETTMSAIRAQGLNRINSTEIGVTEKAGNLWDNIEGWLGKKVAGQPVPPKIQQDMLDFATILEKAAYKKYETGHKSTNELWGTDIKPTFSAPQGDTPTAPPALTPGLQGLANRP